MDEQETKNIQVQLPGDQVVYIETTVPRGEQKVATIDTASLEGVTGAVKGFAEKLKTVLDEVKPDRASIEFGVEVGIESGKLTAVIVKGTGKANLKVTLGWGK